jgi:hypothetical protein
MRVDDATPKRFEENSKEGAYTNAKESKTGESSTPASILDKYDGVGNEAEIEDAVNHRDPVSRLALCEGFKGGEKLTRR